MTTEVCKSYVAREVICADGFPVSAACLGSRCHSCGTWAADRQVPYCQREDMGPHLLDDAGLPLLAHYKRAAGRGVLV